MTETSTSSVAHRIADAVAHERRRRRLTQRQVAAQAGIAPNTMIRIERGEPVRGLNLESVAAVLGLDLDELTTQQASSDASVGAEMVAAWIGDGDDSRERMLHIVRSMAQY